MKLSTWIILRELKTSIDSYKIENGSLSVTSIRLLSQCAPPLPEDILYIDRFPPTDADKENSDRFILINRNDWLIVKGYTLETIINTLLAIFDTYNSWESRLLKLASQQDSLEEIVKISQTIIGNPYCILDVNCKVLALSSQYGPKDFDSNWEYLHEHLTIPPSTMGHAMTDRNGNTVDFWTKNPQIFPDSKYGEVDIIGTLLTIDNEECGALSIYGYSHGFDESDLQLARMFADMLCQNTFFKSTDAKKISKSYILTSLLENKSVPPESLRMVTNQNGIQAPWKIAVLQNIHRKDSAQRNTLINLAKHQSVGCFPLIFKDIFVLVANAKHMDILLENIIEASGVNSLSVGISLPFLKMESISIFYEQAMFTLEHAQNIPGIFRCEQFAFQRLLQLTRKHNDALLLSHPALLHLEEYDQKNHTCFYDTLYKYLIYERSLKNASNALFIHRNSLLYRIERIKEIIGSDLEDIAERTYLLLSFVLEDQKI